ncbi:hypothetical protein ACLMJK_007955 [Lecanora helva]
MFFVTTLVLLFLSHFVSSAPRIATVNSTGSASFLIPGLSNLNDTLSSLLTSKNPYISPLNPTKVVNHGSFSVCTIVKSDINLVYTLIDKVTETQFLNLLFVARRQTEIQVNLGYGNRPINPPVGHYKYDLGGLGFLAADKGKPTTPHLTWDALLQAIIMLGYCGAGNAIFREFDAKVICHAPKPAADSPLIIFFRRGIFLKPDVDFFAKRLAFGAGATVVEIGYPLSSSSPYPLPVHAALAGFDWTRKNLLNDSNSTGHDPVNSVKPRNIGVCGELIGGSLAAMLALTECHSTTACSGPCGISAVALCNPIVDWTNLFDTNMDPVATDSAQQAFGRKTHETSQTTLDQSTMTSELTSMRNRLFPKAESYFDSFASPLLFFRTPTSEIPIDARLSTSNESDGDIATETPDVEPVRKRRSFRKYPPTGFDLELPHMRIEVGNTCVLKDQGIELVECMHRSFQRTERDAMTSGRAIASRSFEIIEREGLGLWDLGDALEIGRWFYQILREGKERQELRRQRR